MKSLKSWKTTLAGSIGIALAIVKYVWPEHSSFFVELIALATSAGLIAARDNNRSSEDVGAK